MVRVVDGQLGYPAATYQAQDRSAAVVEAAALDTGLCRRSKPPTLPESQKQLVVEADSSRPMLHRGSCNSIHVNRAVWQQQKLKDGTARSRLTRVCAKPNTYVMRDSH